MLQVVKALGLEFRHRCLLPAQGQVMAVAVVVEATVLPMVGHQMQEATDRLEVVGTRHGSQPARRKAVHTQMVMMMTPTEEMIPTGAPPTLACHRQLCSVGLQRASTKKQMKSSA